ncbi:MAG: FliI/YscN family ATPase, partial [Planctomycetes bacterium]|nr:FliI/YscN family ATPase [Planctomycetota bacterium]
MPNSTTTPDLKSRWDSAIQRFDPARVGGRVISSRGLMLTCRLPAAVHDRCEIITGRGTSCLAEVVGFSNELAYLFLYENSDQVRPNMPVINRGHGAQVPSGPGLLSRVIDGIGRPIDDRGPLKGCRFHTSQLTAPAPLRRTRVREIFSTNVRAIDGLLTCGRGQRLGIFAGSGVGKSTLLGQIARASEAQVNVIALIGERGGEVRPFIEDCLGDGLSKSVVVVATCDEPPLMRVRAAQLALAVADSFRRIGKHVLLMVDSLTRLAMAQRQIGIAHGEPPSARSYTPSVFQLLAAYVECMGNSSQGSITGMLTVLVDGDDFDEPITDAVRSFVDGHIILDRKLAELGHFPSISVGQSISRVMPDVAAAEHQEAARKIRTILAHYAQAEDLI